MKEDWELALNWGLTTKKCKEWAAQNYPRLTLVCKEDYTILGNAIIFNFQGDCGALYVSSAGYLDEENIKAVEELANINGFSKIFATIVKKMTKSDKQHYLDLWKDWAIVDIGMSNRNKDKTDIVLFKRIDCSYKGY